MPTENVKLLKGRSAARLGAVQALYQLEIEPQNPNLVVGQFVTHRFPYPDKFHLKNPDGTLFEKIVLGVHENLEALDSLIEPTLSDSWKMERLESVMKAILRAAIYELRDEPETPTAVIINEYVNLTKVFYSGQEPGFVNASLDRLAKQLNR